MLIKHCLQKLMVKLNYSFPLSNLSSHSEQVSPALTRNLERGAPEACPVTWSQPPTPSGEQLTICFVPMIGAFKLLRNFMKNFNWANLSCSCPGRTGTTHQIYMIYYIWHLMASPHVGSRPVIQKRSKMIGCINDPNNATKLGVNNACPVICSKGPMAFYMCPSGGRSLVNYWGGNPHCLWFKGVAPICRAY